MGGTVSSLADEAQRADFVGVEWTKQRYHESDSCEVFAFTGLRGKCLKWLGSLNRQLMNQTLYSLSETNISISWRSYFYKETPIIATFELNSLSNFNLVTFSLWSDSYPSRISCPKVYCKWYCKWLIFIFTLRNFIINYFNQHKWKSNI